MGARSPTGRNPNPATFRFGLRISRTCEASVRSISLPSTGVVSTQRRISIRMECSRIPGAGKRPRIHRRVCHRHTRRLSSPPSGLLHEFGLHYSLSACDEVPTLGKWGKVWGVYEFRMSGWHRSKPLPKGSGWRLPYCPEHPYRTPQPIVCLTTDARTLAYLVSEITHQF